MAPPGSGGVSADVAIAAEGLGKRYRISNNGRSYRTLKEALSDALRRPFPAMAGRGPAAHDFWAIRDVSFEVHRGEVFGIIGPNGSGKSTLLKVLSRITPPSEGRAEFRGRVASLLEVGTGFSPELTGRENIFLNGAILGMRRQEIAKNLDAIVEFSEVGEFLDTPVKRYSSGMYVRLAFAVAAHLDPEILIADEVLAVGDLAFQQKCLAKMDSAAQAGRTVVLVSHNVGSLANLCDRVMYLRHGHVQCIGPAAEVTAAYVADMIGAPNAGPEAVFVE